MTKSLVLSGSPLSISVFPTRRALGEAAARRFQTWIEEILAEKPRARVVFGCAPSQDQFLEALVREARLKPELWRKVEVFHMDEYCGIAATHPQSFRRYLREHLLDHVPVRAFHLIGADAASPAAEAARYHGLLGEAPIDLIALGFGENGHIAFNDPPVADFADPVRAKVVELDRACRQQQVNDGCFATFDEVPKHAITITVPVFASAARLCSVVPGIRKAQAVANALTGPVGEACPATLIRVHPRAELFLDQESASQIPAGTLR